MGQTTSLTSWVMLLNNGGIHDSKSPLNERCYYLYMFAVIQMLHTLSVDIAAIDNDGIGVSLPMLRYADVKAQVLSLGRLTAI